MNIHKTQLTNCIKAIIITSLGMASNVQAQNVVSASVGPNSINTPCGLPLIGNITSLNVDMVEIDANTSNTRCAWGTGSDTYIWGAGYSGLNQGGSCTNVAGITVGHSIFGQATMPLPAYWTPPLPNPINYIDVAIGKVTDLQFTSDEYFIIAVYESGGNIYLEQYLMGLNGGVFSLRGGNFSGPCFPLPCPLYGSQNPLPICTTGNASRPHIDLIYNKTYPTALGVHEAIGYVVTWQEGNGQNAEVWGADGPLTIPTFTNPQLPYMGGPFPIGPGQMPDVAGVNAAQMPVGTDPDKAYVAYLNRDGDEVHLSEWDFNSGPSYTITNHGPMGAASTGLFKYPRISGPQYYDFGTPLADDPACVVAVSENPGGGANDLVHTYAYFTTGLPTIAEVLDASDYSSLGFGSYNAMKPSITGVGSIVSSLYAGATAAYTDYPTAFYADYNNNNTTWTTSGDMYAMGTDVAQTSSAVVNLQGNNYSEVNGSELEISGYHSLAPGNEPHVAIATTNNSGYNMISAWFGGDLLYFALNNGAMPYQFKPARPSAISNTGDKNFAVYPNPVTDELNVTNAAGSEYIILDITGRKLSSGIINDADDAINVSQYANGMYMLELSKDNKTEKLKFVKQ